MDRMRLFFTFLLICCSFGVKAQKVESISFDLYTDSLKKGVHNYINVVGKMSNGSYYPLMADEVIFTSSAGRWDGNSLILDSSFKNDSVSIVARLKEKPGITTSVIIYMKKNLNEGPLKTEKELLDGWKQNSRKRKN